MHRISALVIHLIFILATRAPAQEPLQPFSSYVWPTDASRFLTSVFGESRARRFHTGIDIKTWGRVGYNVFATRDGYVWRINVSPYGYGKALYLKLDTGEVAVYAHLAGFSDRIQELVEAEQHRRGRYRVDIFLGPQDIPVRAGEIIALTGQTGIGAPHLHFEIRDGGNRTINPLLKGYELSDRLSPTVTKISFSPLDANSEVNGDFRPLILTPQWVRPGEYELAETVSIWGAVGLAVSAYDKDSNSTNLFGVYSLKLFVDGELRFRYQYDDLSFNDNPMIDLERDYRLSQRGLGSFYKLYKDKRNTRSGYDPNRAWAGVLRSASLTARPRLRSKTAVHVSEAGFESGDLFPGLHDFRVEVADFVGNTSVVSGKFKVGAAYKIQPVITEDGNGQYTLQEVITYDLRRLERMEQFALVNNRWQLLPQDFLLEKGGEGDEVESAEDLNQAAFPKALASFSILKLVAYDQFDIPSHPHFFIPTRSLQRSPDPQLSVEFDYYDDYVRLEFTSRNLLRDIPKATLYPGRRDSVVVALHQNDLRTFVGRLPLDKLSGTYHLLKVAAPSLDGNEKVSWFQFVATKIDPPASARLISDDQQCWVNFWNESLYEPLYGRIVTDSLRFANEPGVIGRVYQVEPLDALLKEGAFVHLHYPVGEYAPEKLGVYYKTNRGRWVFIDNNHDASRRSIWAKVLSFEKFALMADEEPPEITAIRPGFHARLTDATPLISANVLDHKSGFRNEMDIELRLDGVKLIAEYDPERHRIFYQVQQPLSKGRHEITVWARDRAKNAAAQTSVFWID